MNLDVLFYTELKVQIDSRSRCWCWGAVVQLGVPWAVLEEDFWVEMKLTFLWRWARMPCWGWQHRRGPWGWGWNQGFFEWLQDGDGDLQQEILGEFTGTCCCFHFFDETLDAMVERPWSLRPSQIQKVPSHLLPKTERDTLRKAHLTQIMHWLKIASYDQCGICDHEMIQFSLWFFSCSQGGSFPMIAWPEASHQSVSSQRWWTHGDTAHGCNHWTGWISGVDSRSTCALCQFASRHFTQWEVSVIHVVLF